MKINKITVQDLKDSPKDEGLVLQGCGGSLKEWVDGINDILEQEGILKNGFHFENVSTFQNQGITCLLFPFDDGANIDIGKLSLWRIANHENFGATWLSDYVMNYLDGYAEESMDESSGIQLN